MDAAAAARLICCARAKSPAEGGARRPGRRAGCGRTSSSVRREDLLQLLFRGSRPAPPAGPAIPARIIPARSIARQHLGVPVAVRLAPRIGHVLGGGREIHRHDVAVERCRWSSCSATASRPCPPRSAGLGHLLRDLGVRIGPQDHARPTPCRPGRPGRPPGRGGSRTRARTGESRPGHPGCPCPARTPTWRRRCRGRSAMSPARRRPRTACWRCAARDVRPVTLATAVSPAPSQPGQYRRHVRGLAGRYAGWCRR